MNKLLELFQSYDAVIYIGQSDKQTKLFATKAYSFIPGNISGYEKRHEIMDAFELLDGNKRDYCFLNTRRSVLTRSRVEELYPQIIKEWSAIGKPCIYEYPATS